MLASIMHDFAGKKDLSAGLIYLKIGQTGLQVDIVRKPAQTSFQKVISYLTLFLYHPLVSKHSMITVVPTKSDSDVILCL